MLTFRLAYQTLLAANGDDSCGRGAAAKRGKCEDAFLSRKDYTSLKKTLTSIRGNWIAANSDNRCSITGRSAHTLSYGEKTDSVSEIAGGAATDNAGARLIQFPWFVSPIVNVFDKISFHRGPEIAARLPRSRVSSTFR